MITEEGGYVDFHQPNLVVLEAHRYRLCQGGAEDDGYVPWGQHLNFLCLILKFRHQN